MALVTVAAAAPLSVTVAPSNAPWAEAFHMGSSRAPDGSTISIDRQSLLLDGRPWTPVMGEFHYSRYPAAEWREELLKMKAGGISVVSTYVFWIHHEEIEGQWDWSGDRDLREFVRLAGSVGLKVIVRCGPWCHGEVRNGGFPDWLLVKGWTLRSTDPRYLGKVGALYGQIAAQIRGELWKDGGPVIGIQVENEYQGPADYLMALKGLALKEGLDVPLYTRTGWTKVTTPLGFGEIVPLYGAYAEGFWSRELTSMPGNFWNAFRFTALRFDDNIASEQLGKRDVHDAPDVRRYPYLTCEIGGGMMSSYHRRILIDPMDVASTVLVKLGSGSSLPGYYMYHGGTNPAGRLTTLMESQATAMTNYNDMPVMNYDFQAPLGEFGQIRPQYHLLRRLHLFLADFGASFARMPAYMPDAHPGPRGDTATLRWAVRSDGTGGFVFVNNFERSLHMPAKDGVQFTVTLPAGPVTFPKAPVAVPEDSLFFWPFNFDMGDGVTLAYATAEPICAVDDTLGRTFFFAETRGVPAEFAFAGEARPRTAKPGRGVAFRIAAGDGRRVQVVLLSDLDSLALWKGRLRGRDRALLTRAGLVIDGETVRLTASVRSELSVGIYPELDGLSGGERDGLFTRYTPPAPPPVILPAVVAAVRKAAPARDIPLGTISEPVAAQPTAGDFRAAAVWRVTLPPGIGAAPNPILRIRYVGDVARLTLNGRLLVDDFYNGNALDLGLRRYGTDIVNGELLLSVLPLRQDALSGPAQRIFLPGSARPDFKGATQIAEVLSAEIVPSFQVEIALPPTN